MRVIALLLVVGVAGAAAQSAQRLPLPLDTVAGALTFEAQAPTAGVLTGLLMPAAGALTAWAPVWSLLGADGALVESQTGVWQGTRPAAWRKLVKPGFVVAGLRLLLKTGTNPAVQQVQVLWRAWQDGAVTGSTVVGPVIGAPAAAADTTKVVELRLPDGAVPVGLWGQTSGGSVVQVSLTVRLATSDARTTTAPQAPSAAPVGPKAPTVPPVTLLNSP